MTDHPSYSELTGKVPHRNTVPASLFDTIRQSGIRWVVLDDDPTGTQTVHDVPVITDWSVSALREAFREEGNLFFVLTNSRALSVSETASLHREILRNVSAAAKETGAKYLYISRSDSTLRGHYPLETDLLAEGLTEEYGHLDGDILYPFFPEGGRYTADNIHYVRYGEEMVPAAETEFAKDVTFGYHSSDLTEYVEEKTGGAVSAGEVLCVTLDDLRSGDPQKVTELLKSAEHHARIIVNSLDYEDVKMFVSSLYEALADGKIFVFRTAAAFVKTVGGISDRPLLNRTDFPHENSNGGIVAVGSHTAKTTAQLEELCTLPNVETVEFQSSKVLGTAEEFEEEIRRCIRKASEIIQSGKTAAVYTERKLLSLPQDTGESALARSVRISDGLARIVRDLPVRPAFVIAKGGITSADVAVKSLKIRKATVWGQIRPGIPVWRCEESAVFGAVPYVVFPGNVGDRYDLKKAVSILTGIDI